MFERRGDDGVLAKTLVARQQIVAEIDGKTVVVLEGARFPANDPIVKGREAMFEAPASKRAAKR